LPTIANLGDFSSLMLLSDDFSAMALTLRTLIDLLDIIDFSCFMDLLDFFDFIDFSMLLCFIDLFIELYRYCFELISCLFLPPVDLPSFPFPELPCFTSLELGNSNFILAALGSFELDDYLLTLMNFLLA